MFSRANLDIESIIAKFDLEKLSETTKNAIANNITNLPEEDKVAVKKWLDSVENIRKETGLNIGEKEKVIHSLETSKVILNLLKSILDSLVDKAPVENKTLLKGAIAGVGLVATAFNIEFAGISLIIIQKGLPKFLLSDIFPMLSDFIRGTLSKSEPAKLK